MRSPLIGVADARRTILARPMALDALVADNLLSSPVGRDGKPRGTGQRDRGEKGEQSPSNLVPVGFHDSSLSDETDERRPT
jgi:stalled ribosome alternative rescue factor ArfA